MNDKLFTFFPVSAYISNPLIEHSSAASVISHSKDDSDKLIFDPKFIWKDECYSHNWKPYTGLNEQFEYCTKCDAKRDPKTRYIISEGK